MPAKPAPIKKSPAKKAAAKEEKPAEPAPEAPPAEAAPAEAAPAEAAPAEAVPAEAAPAPVEGEAAPAAEPAAAAPAEEAAAPAPAEGEAPAEAAAAPTEPAAEEGAVPAAEAPAAEAPAEAPAEDAAAAPAEAPAEAAPAEAAPVEEPPKPPTPPPPPEPTSAPLNLTVEDVNATSVTLKWQQPETIGDSGLDGYTVEYCKEGAAEWVVANAELTVATKLVVAGLTTGDVLNMRVVAVNPGGRSEPAVLAEAVPVRDLVERPKVRLPRSLRTRYVRKVGAQINLVIPFLGKPKPVVSWTKDGEPLDTKRVGIRNSDRDSILFIRTSEREDSGVYEITVKIDSFLDKASLTLQIVDLPGPPASVKLVDTWGFNAALEWTPPKDSGNTEITGYNVQKADKKTGEWFTVLENYHRLNATISDLIMGNSYNFRVFSVNKVGVSEKSVTTKEVATIQKTVPTEVVPCRAGIVYTPPEYQEHDFSEVPKFTAPLIDRAATVGYTTKLLCAVRGCPKPKIEWLKNQMVIGDDPKYRQLSNLGVCSLEIRKPCSFDGGVYTCRAKNDNGVATVSCKLEVKQVIIPEK
ncbi:myosin binding protein Ha isoform X3 [Alosa pseudoharengus]|uniref:myosin binding protein Ha isoform X3 n=1 Tax=Alosa pseudoharengus TaxID=34774 RepID=UPI003F886D94